MSEEIDEHKRVTVCTDKNVCTSNLKSFGIHVCFHKGYLYTNREMYTQNLQYCIAQIEPLNNILNSLLAYFVTHP